MKRTGPFLFLFVLLWTAGCAGAKTVSLPVDRRSPAGSEATVFALPSNGDTLEAKRLISALLPKGSDAETAEKTLRRCGFETWWMSNTDFA